MTDRPDDDDWFEPDEPESEDERLERLAESCGSRRKRQCDLLGTEWCDWLCPFRDEVFPPKKRHRQ